MNVMVSSPGFALASLTTCSNVPAPPHRSVLVTVNVVGAAAAGAAGIPMRPALSKPATAADARVGDDFKGTPGVECDSTLRRVRMGSAFPFIRDGNL